MPQISTFTQSAAERIGRHVRAAEGSAAWGQILNDGEVKGEFTWLLLQVDESGGIDSGDSGTGALYRFSSGETSDDDEKWEFVNETGRHLHDDEKVWVADITGNDYTDAKAGLLIGFLPYHNQFFFGTIDEVSHIPPDGIGTVEVNGAWSSALSGSPTVEARNRTGHTGWDDSEVHFYWNQLGNEWCIIQHNGAHVARGLMQGALADTDNSKTVDNLDPAVGNHLPFTSITGHNIFNWEANDNAETYLTYNETSNQWEMTQVECP